MGVCEFVMSYAFPASRRFFYFRGSRLGRISTPKGSNGSSNFRDAISFEYKHELNQTTNQMESMQVETTVVSATPAIPSTPVAPVTPSTPSSPRKYKPTYLKMVERALAKSSVLSYPALVRYISQNFPVPSRFKTYLRAALKRGIKEKKIVAVKRSYKLAKKAPISRKAKVRL